MQLAGLRLELRHQASDLGGGALHRGGLEHAAYACYAIITRSHARLLGRYPKGTQPV